MKSWPSAAYYICNMRYAHIERVPNDVRVASRWGATETRESRLPLIGEGRYMSKQSGLCLIAVKEPLCPTTGASSNEGVGI